MCFDCFPAFPEKSFARKYSTSVIGKLGCVMVAVFFSGSTKPCVITVCVEKKNSAQITEV